ncbi:MAG: Asp23/Gls24 family envelope stress response protein [Selenomonas sp.]|nr:Asp23/Gls24 family envelope stress response protein [Selenomonas sp.]MBQ1460570.1 Asp23/Gls24 family envelope stress response protein [Selenomonas sp.]MBQ1613261.1 Asp23/Gls24 family envelope stress response protein [Selenomonas sp.]MBQ1919323.1 Asp23/Gls24 family envelope stress response protein [Selenomonas sp.]MBQ2087033.1 Asp23/Gls24 family envelope stress response protein [Selenomonas sp.]
MEAWVMEQAKEMVKKDNSLGSIRIADEVVSIIAGLAATEVEGIAGMSGGIAGGIAEMLGRKNFAKGVKVEVGEKEAAVDLYIIVKYGVRIPDVALAAQENVKQAIENMTGLSVVEVNIHVQGVGFPDEEGKVDEVRVR